MLTKKHLARVTKIETSVEIFWFLLKANFGYVVKVIQISVDQVSQAYANPKINLDSSAVTGLILFLDKERKNNAQLFKAENGKIYQYVFSSCTRNHIYYYFLIICISHI